MAVSKFIDYVIEYNKKLIKRFEVNEFSLLGKKIMLNVAI